MANEGFTETNMHFPQGLVAILALHRRLRAEERKVFPSPQGKGANKKDDVSHSR